MSSKSDALKARQSLEKSVGRHLQNAYLAIRTDGFVDVEAISTAVKGWADALLASSKQEEVSTASADSPADDPVRVADLCSQLRLAVQRQLVEAEAAVFQLCGDPSPASGSGSTASAPSAPGSPPASTPPLADSLSMGLANPVSHVDPFARDILPPAEGATMESTTDASMVEFIISLGGKDSPTQYKPTQLRQMLLKLQAMLHDVEQKINPEAIWVTKAARTLGHLKPEAAARVAVERLTAAFIYSVDAKDCDCKTLEECRAKQLEDAVAGEEGKHRTKPNPPADATTLGYNGNHWAMLNWALRVAGDGTAAQLDEEARGKLRNFIGFFAPLVRALEGGLQIVPREPRVVFRGVNLPLASKYRQGSEVVFPAFTSTSLEGSEAMKFMGSGGTYFVLSTRGGGLIADFSHYPEQAEALLLPNTKFVVTSKMSRTLLQLLGNDFDVVFMSEIVKAPSGDGDGASEVETDSEIAEAIRLLVDGSRASEFVYASYKQRYVEGRVSLKRPGTEASGDNDSSPATRVLPLYKATDHFVEVSGARQMLLLGAGGAGKTSALVGCLCHLVNKKDRSTRPLLPIFVSLPGLGQAIFEQGGLDHHIREQLRLSKRAFDELRSATRIVLLLDSLDEVAPQKGSGRSIIGASLLDPAQNPWCATCKAIVSCRTEAVDAAGLQDNPGAAIATFSSGATIRAPMAYHVWPFDGDDRVQFMENVAAERIRELAKREAESQFRSMKYLFQLNEDEMKHPCLLAIATQVTAAADRDAQPVLTNKYSLYEKFVMLPLRRGKKNSTEFSEELREAVMDGLENVALQMATERNWQLPVSAVEEAIRKAYKAREIDTGDDEARSPAAIMRLLPSRCEDINDGDAMWGFWHKTVGEFCVARHLREGGYLSKDKEATLLAAHPGVAEFVRLGRTSSVGLPRPGKDADEDTVKEYWTALAVPVVGTALVELDLSGMPLPDSVGVRGFDELQMPNLKTLKTPVFDVGDHIPPNFVVAKQFTQLEFLNMSQSFPHAVSIGTGFMRSYPHKVYFTCPKFEKLDGIYGDVENCFVGANFTTLDMMSFNPKADVLLQDFCSNCTQLENVNFPMDSCKLRIGQKMLAGCVNLTTIDFMEFTEPQEIGDDFLRNCESVDMVEIPPNITAVGARFVAGCGCLPELDIAPMAAVTSVGDDFMCECESLASIDLAPFASVTKVGNGFLKETHSLQEVDLAPMENLRTVGDEFLYHCNASTVANIPALTAIGDGFLRGSSVSELDLCSLSQLTAVGNGFLCGVAATEIDITPLSRVTTIGDHFINECEGLTSLKVSPDMAVHQIGWGFLYYCSALESVDLSMLRGVKKVPKNFLYGCSELKQVDLTPLADVVSVGDGFLGGTYALESVDLSPLANVETIGKEFLSGAEITQLDLSPLANVRTIGDDFCDSLKGLNFAPLAKATQLGKGFYTKNKLSKEAKESLLAQIPEDCALARHFS